MARHPLCPWHTVGAVAAVHTGDLAVHTGCPGLAGGGAAGDALIVGKGRLLAVHGWGGGCTGKGGVGPQLCQDRPNPYSRPWGRGSEGCDLPVPLVPVGTLGDQKVGESLGGSETHA